MFEEILRNERFCKQAALQSAPESPEDVEAVFIGLVEGMKTAGLHPFEALDVIEMLVFASPLQKEAGFMDDVRRSWDGFKNTTKAMATGAYAGYKQPNMVNGAADMLRKAQADGTLQKAQDWYQSYQQGGLGGVAKKLWGTVTDPENVKKWAPYAVSGLGALAATKMMGGSNTAAIGAGLLGGYAGGRVMTNQPIVPQSVKDYVSAKLPAKPEATVDAKLAPTSQARMQQTNTHAADQIKR